MASLAERQDSTLAEAKRVLLEVMVGACRRRYESRLRAAVLTGSLARGEATARRSGERLLLASDAEFLLFFQDGAVLPVSAEIASLAQEIERGAVRAGVGCDICLSAGYADYLRRLRPHIFAHELRVCGEVVWGDPGILGLIPSFEPSDIPLDDAWRLLCNRLLELLEAVALAAPGAALAPEVDYRSVKLRLDMATSLLLFLGAYAPTYGERSAALSRLAESGADRDVPFPLAPFAETVRVATARKLSGALGASSDGGSWAEGVDLARRLWRWELARLTGLPRELPEAELERCWSRGRPLLERLRGWAYLVRREGWLRSWHQWPHWAKRALASSPRNAVYAAGCGLLFRLAETGVEGPRGEAEVERGDLPSWLPLRRPASRAGATWRERALETAWNYRRLLAETRS